MNKKYIALIIIFSLIFASAAVNVFADEQTENTLTENEAVNHLRNLGVLTGFEEFGDNSIVTRAEFAELLVNLINMDEQIGEVDMPNIYIDVSEELWQKKAIYYCTKSGWLVGVGNNLFMPNAPVERNQIIKVLVDILGYSYLASANGGYPSGYNYVASKIGLLKSVPTGENGIAFRQVAQIFFNALLVDISEISGVNNEEYIYSSEKGVDMLYRYYNARYVRGMLDGINGVTLTTGTSPARGSYSIDGNVYYSDDDFSQSLGLNVSAIVSTESSIENRILSFSSLDGKNKITEIDTSDVIGGGVNNFLYEKNDKSFSVNISSDATILFNMSPVIEFNFANLDHFRRGRIVLLDNNSNGEYDVVFVYEYETYIVERIYKDKIYGKNNTKAIDTADIDKPIYMTDKNGKGVSLGKISEKNILLVADGNDVVSILYCDETVEGIVESYTSKEIIASGESYKINEELLNVSLKPSSYYKFSLDATGRVADYVQIDKDSHGLAYIVKIRQPQRLGRVMKIKLFGEDGNMRIYDIDDKIRVNGIVYKELDDAEKFKNFYANFLINNEFVPQLVQIEYEGTEDDPRYAISEIITAKEILNENEDGFCKGEGDVKTGTTEYFKQNSATGMYAFGGKTYIDSNTKIFVVPEVGTANSQDSDYSIAGQSNITNGNTYTTTGYYLSKNNFTADAVVLYAVKSMLYGIGMDTLPGVFVRTFEGIDEDGVRSKMAEINDGTIRKVVINDFESDFADLKKGDVIRFAYDDKNVLTSNIQVVYRYSIDEWIGNNGGANPSFDRFDDSVRMALGYVSFVDGDGNIRVSYDGNIYNDSRYLSLYGYKMSSSYNIITVEGTGDDAKVRIGDVSDIAKGDRILTHQRSGLIRTVIIFKKGGE